MRRPFCVFNVLGFDGVDWGGYGGSVWGRAHRSFSAILKPGAWFPEVQSCRQTEGSGVSECVVKFTGRVFNSKCVIKSEVGV